MFSLGVGDLSPISFCNSLYKKYFLYVILLKERMIILTTSTSPQTFSILPREYVTDVTICIRDESTNMRISNTSGTVIFRDKIFCTDQTIDQSNDEYYDMNLGVYKENTSGNNDYIIF